MKKTILLLSVIALVACVPACSTFKTQVTQLDPVKVGHAIEVVASVGATAEIAKDPNSRAYFVAAETVVSALINGGQYDSASLKAALDTISVNEIKNSDEVKASIQTSLVLYAAFEGDVVSAQVNKNAYLSQALRSLDAGLKQALQ